MMLVKSSPLLYFLAIFAISCCYIFAKQLLLFLLNLPSPLLSSPLFYRWWNCPSLYIIWNMSRWSRTYEELGIITSRLTLRSPLFSVMMPWCSKFMIKWWLTCFWGLYCYYSFFIYYCFIGLLWFIDLFDFLYLLTYLKHTFLHLLEQSAE